MSSTLDRYKVNDVVYLQQLGQRGDVFKIIQIDPNSGRIVLQDPNNPWWKSKQETNNG